MGSSQPYNSIHSIFQMREMGPVTLNNLNKEGTEVQPLSGHRVVAIHTASAPGCLSSNLTLAWFKILLIFLLPSVVQDHKQGNAARDANLRQRQKSRIYHRVMLSALHCAHQPLGELVKMQRAGPHPRGQGRAWDSAFLTSLQVMLVHRPCFE
jgi:hypothetical protein